MPGGVLAPPRNQSAVMQRMVEAGAPQAGGSRGFLAPLAASPDPLREPRYNLPSGNRGLSPVWTPLTIDPLRSPGGGPSGAGSAG